MPTKEQAVSALLNDFVNRLVAAIRVEVAAEVQTRVLEAIGSGARRGPGRPPSAGKLAFGSLARNSLPKQLCPVPNCKNAAAPVFGMLCSDHKDLPKAKVAAYREARRKAKLAEKSNAKLAARAARGARPAARPVRKGPPSPARQLQGKYLGALRSLKGEARAKVKALAQSKGVAAAVKLAKSLKKAK